MVFLEATDGSLLIQTVILYQLTDGLLFKTRLELRSRSDIQKRLKLDPHPVRSMIFMCNLAVIAEISDCWKYIMAWYEISESSLHWEGRYMTKVSWLVKSECMNVNNRINMEKEELL